ncbi:uncharacterized protein LOC125776629 isoform X1 [Bactrocera dorsalis]|uniref:Uncharacterized protein LOC125776629 isoform X1 n=1 Tax=Bactrocera dorsalis TaxID=27457 RepID=A0ABM3J9W7_BACDO|nr:uncharacterized protein LOC125776629 isoform X1 [Bactrocera dorsalis]
MQPNARLNAVRKLHVCLNCLSDSHEVKNCKSMFNCNKCKQRHHSMIHRDQSEGIAQTSDSTDTTEISTKSHVASIKANISNVPTSRSMLLGTAMVTICHNESTFTVRALIDSGSEATFVSNSLQKRLLLATKTVSARVSGLNNTVSGQVQSVCSITIGSPRNKSLRLEAEALVLPKLTGLLPSRSINSSILKRLPNIPLADNNFHTSQKVDLLIGADLYPKIILNGVKLKISGSLVAQRTVFGWIITGSVPSEETKVTGKDHKQNSTIIQQQTQNHFCRENNSNSISIQQKPHQHRQQQQQQQDQTNNDGETNYAPGSSNHSDTHGGAFRAPGVGMQSHNGDHVSGSSSSQQQNSMPHLQAFHNGLHSHLLRRQQHATAAMQRESAKAKRRKNRDPDELFLLSLYEEIKRVPEEIRLDVKGELIQVLQKYQKNPPVKLKKAQSQMTKYNYHSMLE